MCCFKWFWKTHCHIGFCLYSWPAFLSQRLSQLMKKCVSFLPPGSGGRQEVENSRQVGSRLGSQRFPLFPMMPPASIGKPSGTLQGYFSVQAAGSFARMIPERPEQIKHPAEKKCGLSPFFKVKIESGITER